MALEQFHPAVAGWFASAFEAPTPAQRAAWPAIASGRHALVAAPTGSGKTFAAFLAAVDELVRLGVEGKLADETAVVYVSPLKALSNDIRINLEAPLAGIRERLVAMGLPDFEIRTFVRTGDTPQAERTAMRKRPPHIVVTTPESLYILLGSESGRAMLKTTRTVIVDEIHALVPSKRGSHLALTIERLEALCERRLTRVGLSATQKPIDEVARFLVGASSIDADGEPDCEIVDVGHVRARDLALELPASPLEAVMSGEVWLQVYDRLAELSREHRTTLVFVNTRRAAERAARHLTERLGKQAVAAHHGSMAKEHRLDAEQRLKRGALKVLVATASLELGIDIGDVELVCQLASPRAIAAFLQRVGRSGHAVGGTPKGRLFPTSRDDLVECAALLDSVRRGELDRIAVVRDPLDVLAQQLAAEVGCRDASEAELLALTRRAYPFATLTDTDFSAVVATLSTGYATRRGQRSAMVHRDAVHGTLHARRGTRLTALTSGGTIPDNADYEVVLEPQAQVIGTINEDFAVESLAGDVFQLGNTSYKILRVERGRVRVEDANGAPPSMPFWLGEAPGRSDELSFAVARLRAEIEARIGEGAAQGWLERTVGLSEPAARQLVEYLGAARAALGLLPTQDTLVMERFFDESGGTQLVIHSPFGSRLNRAWGLALRKRFCRKFNFELQAAATEDAIILSLSTSHSFPLDDVAKYLHSNSVKDVLIQAVLDAPMFGVRWRWNASTALALPRYAGGKRVAPQLQRMKSEDLLASVFPDQVACAENLVGEREIPDHPLVAQTLHDCLEEAMDIGGLIALLKRVESGAATVAARDLTAPSPLAAEVLGARPYAYLDDAPLEERRTQAVMSRGHGDPDRAGDLGRLDPEAIEAVRLEAWPEVRNVHEMHQTLADLGYVTHAEVERESGWAALCNELLGGGRAARVGDVWVAIERVPELRAANPNLSFERTPPVPAEFLARGWSREAALVELVRARLSGLGPTASADLAAPLGIDANDIEAALIALESEGYVMRGVFDPDASCMQWCERHLLARIHRYTVKRLRREIEPVEPRDYLRFLFEWQRAAPSSQVSGPDALANVIAQLEGFEAPAGAWETQILPARVVGYEISWLDDLCLTGRVVWTRLQKRASTAAKGAGPVKATPVVLLQRKHLSAWTRLGQYGGEADAMSSRARAVADHLASHGASFFDEIVDGTRLLRTEVENALAELVALGRVNSDSFAGLRALLVPQDKRGSAHHRRGRRRSLFGIEDAGRWALIKRSAPSDPSRDADLREGPDAVEHVARTLLRRYGVVCWRLLEREADWLPPWRDLLRVLHRLEARGEIRGGRFIQGLAGQQFALPEAVGLLRKKRQQVRDGTKVLVSGADPLNLVGSVIAGAKVPALAAARVLYKDGVPIATQVGGNFTALEQLPAAEEWEARKALAV